MTETDSRAETRVSRIPDVLILLLALALITFAATWIFAPGVYDYIPGTDRIDPASYRALSEAQGAPWFGSAERTGLIDFLYNGLVSGGRESGVVALGAFILIIGGVFGIIMHTGAIERGIAALTSNAENPSDLMIPVLFVIFSLCGAVFGMAEETIALTLVLTPVLIRAGYDGITALLVCFCGSQIGFATSWMNPFNVIIAQSVAGVPAMSGIEVRLAMWLLFTTLSAAYVWRYARRVRLAPETSLVYGTHGDLEEIADGGHQPRFGIGDALIVAILVAGVAWVAWGVAAEGYYFAEMGGQFFAIGLAAALVAWAFRLNDLDAGRLAGAFRDGAAQMVPVILIVAAAKGIVLLMGGDDPTVPSLLNATLNALSSVTLLLPEWLTAFGMFLAQSCINFFIPSGSGQAAVTMPLLAPLGDISGVTRQVTVLAFQLGDGLTNLVVPTSAALMGCLTAARVSFGTWLTFIWRPLIALFVMATIFLLGAQAAGFS
ncbi:putative basic amino acid antiporter YfcC [Parasphingopyxis sp.]|uniref:putative basic amino acid antiporter YfcC n=1 Tax=Parasphingopyxis sp. TaxID=1920299 RepID=UPI00261BC28D|nr:putative basic amino acid antiporter YfcC [Parasphingopyxis sp.]